MLNTTFEIVTLQSLKYLPLDIKAPESNILATPKSANFTGAEFSLLASRMLCGCKRSK